MVYKLSVVRCPPAASDGGGQYPAPARRCDRVLNGWGCWGISLHSSPSSPGEGMHHKKHDDDVFTAGKRSSYTSRRARPSCVFETASRPKNRQGGGFHPEMACGATRMARKRPRLVEREAVSVVRDPREAVKRRACGEAATTRGRGCTQTFPQPI